ncbi:hypothetical protein D5R40_34200 [Okeania hirsuta]|uniref:FAD synthase n=1 Tax=Okeania hirsuta TaxID=1458930 RepID=A0A3N6QH53_9CYAN|nr:hypothetical protein D5R40_34200 [Okeania hirsuta]
MFLFTVAFYAANCCEYIQHPRWTLPPRYIVIGYDHRFGLNRQGNIDYLKWHGKNWVMRLSKSRSRKSKISRQFY